MRQTKEIRINDVALGGGNSLVLIAGPCVIESKESSLYHAERIKEISSRIGIPFIFKSSYDKANRTSINSYRGPGLIRGLQILKEVKEKIKVPVLSDVHCRSEIEQVQAVLDCLQVPAFLSRQTDFLTAVAKTGKPVNIKKAQFSAPWDMKSVIEKLEYIGNKNILITERGTTFGYNNLISDLRSLQIIREFGYPVIYDATHSVQLPGAKGVCSGGQREFVCGLAKAAVAMGCDGLFIEVHEDPDKALCDGPNTIALSNLEGLLIQVKRIYEASQCRY